MKCTLNGYKKQFRWWISFYEILLVISIMDITNHAINDVLTMMLTELKDINEKR